MRSANGKYNYFSMYYGRTLQEYVVFVDEKMIEHYNWNRKKLVPCSFGFENLINSIGRIFDNCNNNSTTSEMAEQCHIGWVENYIYWRDNKPYLREPYLRPFNPLNDERREKCASTIYNDLDDNEKEKDLFIVSVVKSFME